MSDWDAVYDQDDFFLQDEPPSPRISVRLIVAAALVGFALLIAAAVFLVNRALRQNELSEANLATALTEANEAVARQFDADAIRRGFSHEASVPPELAAEFEPLFEAFLKAANTDDRLIYRRIVDFPAFLDHVEASPFGDQLHDYSRRELTTTARESVSAAEGWEEIQIRHIVDDPHSPERIIYADALSGDGYSNPIRLWVVRNSGGWKLSDWQTVEHGVRESEDFAIYIAYNDDVYSEYYHAWDALNSAGDLFADDDHEKALTRARDIRTSKRIPLMHDRLLVDLAYLFLEWSENDALKTLDRVTRPEMFPGVFVVRSQALEQLGRHEEAAEVAEDCIARYGNLIEPLRTLVTCRAALHRDDRAQEARRALLRIVPDDLDILREYALGLHDDEKTLLTEHILRLGSGDDTAFTLAQTLAAYDDAVGVAALREAARRQQPESPRLPFFDILIHGIDGEWEQVVAICGRLLDAEKDEYWREIIEQELLSALIYSDKPQEILQACHDKEQTLQYVANMYFDGDVDWSDDEFTEFVTAYRRDNPKDPWGAYYLAQAHSEQEQGDEALETLAITERVLKARQTAEEQSDDDAKRQDAERLQSSIRYLRLRILHQNGHALEAYRTIEPPKETFSQLAAMFRYKTNNNDDDLQALFKAHRAKFPDDPWLTFHEAVQAEKDGELDRANALLTRLLHKQDDGLRWQVLALWNDVQCQQGDFVGALRNTPDASSTMSSISRHLMDKKDYGKLTFIAREFMRMHPRQPAGIVQQVTAAWQQKDYREVVRLLEPWPRVLDELDSWERSRTRMQLVRSYVRLGRHDEAARVADAMETGDNKRLARAIVAVVSGDVDATLKTSRSLSLPWYSSRSLYNDEDAGTLLYRPDFRPVREQVPPPLPTSWYHSPAVLVFAKDAPDRRQKVQDAIRKELGEDVVIRTLPDPRHPTRTHLVAHNDNAQVVVTLARGLAWGEEPDCEELDSESLRRIVRKHAAWIQIQPCDLPDSEQMDFLGRLLASLAQDDCLAVQASGSLMHANAEKRAQLADGLTRGECEALGEQCWLFIENQQHDDDESWNRLKRRSLQKLDRAFAKRTGNQEFSLQVRLTCGIASETSWLKLVRVRRSGHRERSFIATWSEPPLLARRAAAGEFVWIQPHEIVNWKVRNGDSVQFGREAEQPK